MLRVLSYFFTRFLLCLLFSFGLAFLSFTWFLLLTLPAAPYFFSPCFFILALTPIFFIQKDLGLCRPNNIDRIKRVLGPICLYLPKPFCQRTVFCGRFVFCYRLLSLALISLDLSCSSVFLVGLWAIGLFSSWAFGYSFCKNGHQQTYLRASRWIWNLSC